MASTYTFTQKAQLFEPGQLSNFSGVVVDANRIAMGNQGAGPQTTDISASPLSSPQTISNSSVTTLTIPLNAIRVSFLATGNTINISESVSAVTSKYFTIPTGVQVDVDVARCSILYLEANTGSATLSYFFTVV